MINRFKRYLEREFRSIAPTQAAMEYREEVLSNLLDRAQEFRIKGMTDEDVIYDACIDSLGDFRATLLNFESKLMKAQKAARKVSLTSVIALSVVLFFVIAYLVISFATGAWGKTWLMLVAAVFAGIIIFAGVAAAKSVQSGKFLPARACVSVIVVLLFVLGYLFMEIVSTAPNSWMLFLAMVVCLLGADTLIAYLAKSKVRLPELLFFIVVTFSLIYVTLGILGGLWNPYWLIPILGVLVDMVILIFAVSSRNKAKNAADEAKFNAKVNEANEEFYTRWSDR